MNDFDILNIGFGNIVMKNRIVAIIGPDSSPVKRLIQDYRERNMVIDSTCGRRTRSVIFTDCGQIILSALQPETLAGRLSPGLNEPVSKGAPRVGAAEERVDG